MVVPRRRLHPGGTGRCAALLAVLLVGSAVAGPAVAPARTAGGAEDEPARAARASAGGTRLVIGLEGKGTVRVQPGRRSCRAACTTRFRPGTRARLVAVPTPGWALAGWRGACRGRRGCEIRVGRSTRRTVARFERIAPPPASTAQPLPGLEPTSPQNAPTPSSAGPAPPGASTGSAPPSTAPTPPPSPAPVTFFDDFSIDRTGTYDFDRGGPEDIEVKGGVLTRRTTTSVNLCTPSEFSAAEPTVTYKVTTGGRVSFASHYPDITIKRFGGSANRLAVDYQMSEQQFEIFRVVGGAKSRVAVSGTTGPDLAANTSYWLRARIRGNVVRGEIFLTDPATDPDPRAAGSFDHTLVGDDATRFGAGASGTTCIAPHVFHSDDLEGWSADDWRVSG